MVLEETQVPPSGRQVSREVPGEGVALQQRQRMQELCNEEVVLEDAIQVFIEWP